MEKEHVRYGHLTPRAFRERLSACPVAYLPLGTLEYHGPHLPLGTDMLQAESLFLEAAERVGGIVLPPLFLGPDRHVVSEGKDYYGMDVYLDCIGVPKPYPLMQMPGSAYWVEDDLYLAVLRALLRQLSRAGFRVVCACGHGPSVTAFRSLRSEEGTLRLKLLCVDEKEDSLWYIHDHAGMSETSNILYYYPELAHMEDFPADPAFYPPGVAGMDPKKDADPENTRKVLPGVLCRLAERIQAALDTPQEESTPERSE